MKHSKNPNDRRKETKEQKKKKKEEEVGPLSLPLKQRRKEQRQRGMDEWSLSNLTHE